MRIVIAGFAKTGTTGLFAQLRNSIDGDIRTLFEASGYVPQERDAQRAVLVKILIGDDNHTAAEKWPFFLLCLKLRSQRERQ